MKIEIDVNEQMMTEIITEMVVRALKERSGWYSTKEEIKAIVSKAWTVEAENVVRKAMKDLPAIEQEARERLAKQVEARLKKLMKG